MVKNNNYGFFLATDIFSKGGVARYNRFQVKALREILENRLFVFSLIGPSESAFESDIEVNWFAGNSFSWMNKLKYFRYVFLQTFQFRPNLIVTGHINLGPLALVLSTFFDTKIVQNIYGRELWGAMTPLKKLSLKNSDVVISDCYNSANWAIRHNIVNQNPTVIWDCVNTKRFYPAEPNWAKLKKYNLKKDNKFIVLFLGRINHDTRYKGTERLIKLSQKLDPNRFKVVFAGRGNDTEHLSKFAENLGVLDRIVFTGSIHDDDLSDVYRVADVFYLVSEVGKNAGEGIPLTPIEAMSSGVPIMVGNQDGSAELMYTKGGGELFEPEDLDKQFEYISKLNDSEDYLKRERILALKKAKTTFDYGSFKNKTINIVSQIL